MWSARLHSPPVPSLGQQSMAREASTCAQSRYPFSMPDMRSSAMLRHAVCAVNTVPFMIYRGREDEALQTFQLLGHALA